MERAWLIVSIAGLTGAAILLLWEKQDAAFVAAVLGAVAWFLSYRVRLRGTIVKADATEDDVDASEETDEE
ncbi:MAG TPA: hypothetical protein VKB86_12485 [Pyrinomonadaceae bacterium]|nr:hypothetical protein [Pyrinomonadaceae bacterium]